MDADLLPLLVLALLGGLVLIEAAVRRTEVGACAVLGLLLFGESGVVEVPMGFWGMAVYPDDIVFVILATAVTGRLLRAGRRPTGPQLALLGFGLVLVWSVYRGIGVHGLPAAVNEARKYFTFTATALYFSTVEPRRDVLDRLATVWVAAALVLAGLSLLRWVGNAAGIVGGVFGFGDSMRVIRSGATLVLAQGALMALPALRDWWEGWWRWVTPLLLVFAVLLQHRTVWVATAGATVWLLFRAGRLHGRVLVAITAGVAVFAVLSFTIFDDVEEGVAAQLQTSATETNTFEWRVEGWQALVSGAGPETGAEVVTGTPFGGGWARWDRGVIINVSPHNFYLETYLRMGLAGVSCLVLLYVLAIRRPRWRGAENDGLFSRDLLVTVAVMQLIYYVTYTPDGPQAMLLGCACAVAASNWSSVVPERAVEGTAT